MANNEPNPAVRDDCVFCVIADDRDEDAEVIKKSEELVCFKDIYPAAPHHYLVVPTQHIVSCDSLHGGHITLVKRMVQMGKAVLQDRGITDMKDIRLGFHRPPYTSVDHLHLHVLAPCSQISKLLEYKFVPQTGRFVTAQCLLKRMSSAPPVNLASRSSTCSSTFSTLMDPQDASGGVACPFCLIATKQTDTEILSHDEELLCLRDVKPGAAHHYLVVTRTHIDSCRSLRRDDGPLVERMVEMGMSVLEKNKVSDLDDIRMGFHIPPFSSVPHLHLHVLAPASTMGFKSLLRYGPHSHWFIRVDEVISQLKTCGEVK